MVKTWNLASPSHLVTKVRSIFRLILGSISSIIVATAVGNLNDESSQYMPAFLADRSVWYITAFDDATWFPNSVQSGSPFVRYFAMYAPIESGLRHCCRSTNPFFQREAIALCFLSQFFVIGHVCLQRPAIFFDSQGRSSGSPNSTAWKCTAPLL